MSDNRKFETNAAHHFHTFRCILAKYSVKKYLKTFSVLHRHIYFHFLQHLKSKYEVLWFESKNALVFGESATMKLRMRRDLQNLRSAPCGSAKCHMFQQEFRRKVNNDTFLAEKIQ